MSPAVASLLRRLAALAAAIPPGVSQAVTVAPLSDERLDSNEGNISNREAIKTQKLVFGHKRAGHAQLVAHGSHSSHSSHSSHYSGSGAGYTPAAPYVPVPPIPAKPSPASDPTKINPSSQPSIPPRIVLKQSEAPLPVDKDVLMGAVLKKLPKIRSRLPKEVTLKTSVMFNLMDGERVIGIIGLNQGAKLKVSGVKLEHLIVTFSGSDSPMPVANTDIVEQMGGPLKILALPDDPEPKPASQKSASG